MAWKEYGKRRGTHSFFACGYSATLSHWSSLKRKSKFLRLLLPLVPVREARTPAFFKLSLQNVDQPQSVLTEGSGGQLESSVWK